MPKLLRKETHQRDLLQAGRHRHPPHLVLRLCSPNPPRQTRAKPFPRRRRGKAEQIHPRAAPPPRVLRVPTAPDETYRAGAPPGPPFPAEGPHRPAGVGAAAAAPRGRGASRSAAAPLGEVQASPPSLAGAGFPFPLVFCFPPPSNHPRQP